jgi:hypothetical protein
MTTIAQDDTRADQPLDSGRKPRMTDAMREGLDALQREYDAFVESSFQTLAFISDHQTPGK